MPAPAELHQKLKSSKSVVTKRSVSRDNGDGPEVLSEYDLACLYGVRNPSDLYMETGETKETKETGETGETRATEETRGNQEETRRKPANHSPIQRNIHQEVLDWLDTCDGVFTIRDITNEFGALAHTLLYNNIKLVLFKLIKSNTIERVGSTRGVYRKVEDVLEEMNWWDVCNEEYPLELPLGVGRLCKLMPKSIVVIAGEQNSSKSAIALNIAKDNCLVHKTHYFNSEMSEEELRDRIGKFDDVDANHFRRVKFYPRTENFQDVIFPDDLNIIDFLEIHDEFWRIGGIFRAIYDKLEKGCAVVNIQKTRGADQGRGGSMSIEKARLYLSVSTRFDQLGKPYNQAKIIKAKLYRDFERNPNGMTLDFRVYGGAKLLPLSDWSYPGRKS